jgi:methyl-accepting chemotaxis protein
MNFLQGMKLSRKLYLLVACFVAGFLIFSLVFKNTLDTLKIQGPLYTQIVQDKDLLADILPPPEYILESYLVVLRAADDTGDKLRADIAQFKKLRADFDDRRSYWMKNLEDGPMKDVIATEAYQPAKDFFDIAEREYFPLLSANKRQQAAGLASGAMETKYEEHRRAIDKLVKLSTDSSDAREKNAAQVASNRMLLLVSIAVIILAITITLSIFIIRAILGQLGGDPTIIANATQMISSGDLNIGLGSSNGSSKGVIADMQKMSEKLKEVVAHVKQSAENVDGKSHQLTSTSDDLSKGSKNLDAQIDQVVTAMTEVSQTIMDMAKNSTQAAEASKNASATATKGKQIVDSTAEDMRGIATTVQAAANTIQELGRSSAQIGEIVAVINGIADQTNLLALNAAIEAARAGEQGRGFAVVADEVRKLAERTGQATKDIAQRIASIQAAATESVGAMEKGNAEVERGVALAKEASASMDTIVASSSNAMDMVQRIAAATEQQSAATEEVTQSMESIAHIIKQSSTSAEHIQSSAGELAGLSSELKTTVAWFRA